MADHDQQQDLVSASWNPLGDVYYRKEELYIMEWAQRVDLTKFRVAAGTYGGPIAITREESHASSAGPGTRPVVYIFTSSGRELSSFKWGGGNLIKMAWAANEDLLLIGEDGYVYVHNIFGDFKQQFSIGAEVQKSKVLECSVFESSYGTGICVLSGDYQYYLINNIEEVKLKRLQCPIALEQPPSSWTVLAKRDEQVSKVLMAMDAIIYELDVFQPTIKNPKMKSRVSAYIDMAVSFNQKYIAVLSDTGVLWIGSSDLEQVYCEYNTHQLNRPIQLVWCGSGAVVGYWENYLMMIGPYEDTIKHYVDSRIHLVQEVDGVRLIGSQTHEILQKVPSEVEDVFKLGSMKPGSMLRDASNQYDKKSVKVDDYMRAIKDHLQEAVLECIKAAGHEFNQKRQRNLLKAASFGKSFLQDMRPQTFVEMCQTLRVLNNVRDYTIGIPLTFDQLQRLTIPVLIDRLVLRRHYYLAIEICNYLRIPKRDGESRVLAHWACYKVQQEDVDDDELAQAIAAKLRDTPGISYTEIASKALDKGRTALAIRLLDYEPKAADQVPLLIRIGKDEHALQKAVDSGDTDLVYMVIEYIKKNTTLGEFLRKIRNYPSALNLYVKDCKLQDRRLLVDIYYQEDQFRNSGNAFIQDSYAEKAVESRKKLLSKAKESFDNKGPQVFAFGAAMTAEQIKLLDVQKELEDKLGRRFLDLPVNETLYELIYQGHDKRADQIKKDFGVPDTRFWWIKIQALGASKSWVELDKFSKSKKSPIGYEPFVEVCMKYGDDKNEAEKYIAKVPLERRFRLFFKIGCYAQAADTAFQLRSLDDLTTVLSKCGSNRTLVEKIQGYRAQLSQKR